MIEGSACVWMVRSVSQLMLVSGVSQGSVLGPLLFILYTSELFHIVGNHIVEYADDTTIYAVICEPLLRPQVMEFLNQDLSVINF